MAFLCSSFVYLSAAINSVSDRSQSAGVWSNCLSFRKFVNGSLLATYYSALCVYIVFVASSIKQVSYVDCEQRGTWVCTPGFRLRICLKFILCSIRYREIEEPICIWIAADRIYFYSTLVMLITFQDIDDVMVCDGLNFLQNGESWRKPRTIIREL